MRQAIRSLAHRVTGHSLLRNSGFLMGTTVVTSLLGYTYWLLAAHTYPSPEVGFATGTMSTFTLVGYVFSLGVAPLFVRALPRLSVGKEWNAFVSAGFVVTAATAGTAGLLTALLLPPWVPNFGRLHHLGMAIAFITGCIATAVGVAADGMFVSMRRSDRQFARNFAFAAAKIPLLVAPVLLWPRVGGAAIIWTWDAALWASVALAFVLLRRLRPEFRFAPRRGLQPILRNGRLMLAYQLSWLGGWLPVFAFPILVVAEAGLRSNAYFYFTWSIGGVFFMVSTSVSAALFAEGTNRPDVHRQARLALKVTSAILLPMTVVTLLFAHEILLVFGREYADHGAGLLRICALGALPDAVTNAYVAVRQAQRRLRPAVTLNFAMAALALIGATLLLPRWGINAVGWSWTGAQAAGALWVTSGVLRRRRAGRPARGGRAPAATHRVCVVGSGWRFTSGISYYTCRLANALSESHEVSVILMRRLIPRFLYPGRARVGKSVNTLGYDPAIDVYDGVDWFWLPSLIGAIRSLRRHRPETMVLQWWTGAVLHTYLLLAVVARRQGARVLVEFHEVQDTGESRLPLARIYARWVSRAVLRRCDGGLVHSDFDRIEVSLRLPVGELPLVVAPHGPFDHHLPAGRDADRAADCETNLLFFGTIRPYKGLEHLVEAFNALTPDEVASLRLTVVGEPWEGWTLPIELIERSPHRDRITLVDRYVHDDEVAEFFARADAAVLPYTRSSASGPLHIAMAAGLPVVVTDVGGLRDAAGDYAGAVWVAPSDPAAIRAALLRLPALRGERFADPRSWRDTVAAYEQLKTQVVAACV